VQLILRAGTKPTGPLKSSTEILVPKKWPGTASYSQYTVFIK
jgi:hypothetical protein